MSDSHRGVRAHVTGWGIYATLGFVACVVVHLGTYVGRTLSPNSPLRFAFPLGVIPVFIALCVRSRPWQPERTLFTGVRYRSLDWRAWRPFLPAWVSPVVSLLGVYWLGTFAVTFAVSALHVLPRGGRPPTSVEAMYLERMVSSGLLIFYGLPALFFAYVPREPAATSAPREAAP
jgi:hypothetical protein